MKIYPYSNHCRVCDETVPSGHYHTFTQVILWIWDSQHKAWRAAIVALFAAASLALTCLLVPLITTLRELL